MMELKKLVLGAVLAGCSFHALGQVSWPAVNQQTRPWARWWWQGSAVNPADLKYNMSRYKDAGLGGLEITPIYGVKGAETSFVDFLSPRWMELLVYTLKEARQLGLGIDIANGTGWPFGGPWIKDKDASKTVYHKQYQVQGGGSLREPVRYQVPGFVRTANTKSVQEQQLKKDIAANTNLQELALDQVRFSEELAPRVLMAYSDKGEVLDLTGKVAANGTLNWVAPAGSWNLYALFEGLHGKMVERAAPGGEGYAIDHFSKEAIGTFLRKFDTAFKGHDLSYMRALFNDSYEVDDARGQHNWTPQLFTEFRQRRGYDLQQHLPALFQKDTPEKNVRVLYDYRATIDELILEHFTRAWKQWGDSKGKIIRNQSHGSPANLLDLYGAIDIPETEGNDILRFKFASSAAHVLGKPLTSSESATWLNEHFLSSWGDVKKCVDLFLLAGVNHIFYHGVNYSPKDAAWPGWLFYAATHFNEANPQWKDFKALNEYVTRAQSFLQAGKPDNDVLVYFPLADRYSMPGNDLLQHFDGMEKNFEGTDFEHVSKDLQEKGYAFDFFSDRQLLQMQADAKGIRTGGVSYRTILLPGNKYIPDATFTRLLQLVQAGAQVLVYKQLPSDIPGYHNLDTRRKSFQQQLAQLSFKTTGNLQEARLGKGRILVAGKLEQLLEAGKVRRESMTDAGLQCVRRSNGNGHTYFIVNNKAEAYAGWVSLSVPLATVALFEPMDGRSGLARTRRTSKGTEVYVQIAPGGSCILQTYGAARTGKPFAYNEATGTPIAIEGNWQVRFENGGPVLPAPYSTSRLESWTNRADSAYQHFSGTARYQVSFARPAQAASKYLLNLGQVEETAEVFLNGTKIATLVGPSFEVAIPASLLQAQNELAVVVANNMANRIRYMDRNGLEWKKFYNINMSARIRTNLKDGVFSAAAWEPQPSGLLGPVTLTPAK